MESGQAGKIGPLEKFFRKPLGGIVYLLWVTFVAIFVIILIGQGVLGSYFDYCLLGAWRQGRSSRGYALGGRYSGPDPCMLPLWGSGS